MRRPVGGGSDRWLRVRLGLFFVAGAFLLASMQLDRPVFAIPALVIGVAALLMRFLPGDEAADETGADSPDE